MRLNKRLILSSFLFVSYFFTIAQTHTHATNHPSPNAPFTFIQNKGQWKKSVDFKCPIPSGNLYLEKNRLVYNFIDFNPVSHNHADDDSHHEEFNPKTDKLNGHCFFVNFIGGNQNAFNQGKNKKEGIHNYYLGNDPSKWASNVPLYSSVVTKNIYSGIDLHSGNSNGQLKFEFFVNPQSNPAQIQLEYVGVADLKVKNQELIIKTSLGQITEEKPVAYQVIEGSKVFVDCKYALKGSILGFDFPNGYNKNYELVIDPTLMFSTYSGSFADNFGFTATYDSEGYLYSGSIAFAQNQVYPTTPGAFQTSFQGGADTSITGRPPAIGNDIAISKYDTSGTQFIYSTYIGGSANEAPHSLVVNSFDELYIYGTTSSTDFPVTPNSFQSNMNNPQQANWRIISGMGVFYNQGSDMFVLKLSKDGKNLLAGTYIGGSDIDGVNDVSNITQHTLRYNYADDVRGEIDIDNEDNVYVVSCTNSNDFPMRGSGYDQSFNGGGQDGIIIKLKPELDSIIWSSYLGGNGLDAIYSLAIDKNNDVYVAGGTTSNDTAQFPSGSHPNHSLSKQGRSEGFITHFKSDGSQVLNSTFYGTGNYDQIYFVELDRKNNVFVLGQTEDSTNYFIKDAAYNNPREGVFISKFTPQLDSIYWSTTIGGMGTTSGRSRPQLSPTAFLVDVCNSVYFSGWGGLTNHSSTGLTNNFSAFPINLDTTLDAYQGTTDDNDFYLCAISDDASFLIYGSYFGGNISGEHVDGGTSRFDKKGIIYQSVCAGCGGNSDFPILPNPGAVSVTNKSGNCNNAVFKMDFKPPAVISEFQVPKRICIRDSVRLTNLSKEMSTPQYFWDFGNGDTSHQENPEVYYSSGGVYTITLAISDTGSCNFSDTSSKTVIVELPKAPVTLAPDTICQFQNTVIGTTLDSNNQFLWTPGKDLNDSILMNPTASPLTSTNYLLQSITDVCIDSFYQFVQVDSSIIASVLLPDSICAPDSLTLINQGFTTQGASYNWIIPGIINSPLEKPTVFFSQKGNYPVLLIISDSMSCNKIDTNLVFLSVLSDSSYNLPSVANCNSLGAVIGVPSNSNFTYTWSPTKGLSDSTVSNPTSNFKTDLNYTLYVDRGVCTDTLFQTVLVDSIALKTSNDTDVCDLNNQLALFANSFGLANTFIWSSNSAFTDTLNNSTLDSTVLVSPSGFSSTYYSKVISSRGCEMTDSSIIRINNFGIVVDSTQSICNGDTVQLSISSLVPNDSLTVLWNPYQHIIGRNDTSHILVNPP
ncbi:MAG: PKD domain-containing protein, partial [Salibacteraceae bacterium]